MLIDDFNNQLKKIYADELKILQKEYRLMYESLLNYDAQKYKRSQKSDDEKRQKKLNQLWNDVEDMPIMQSLTALANLLYQEWYNKVVEEMEAEELENIESGMIDEGFYILLNFNCFYTNLIKISFFNIICCQTSINDIFWAGKLL